MGTGMATMIGMAGAGGNCVQFIPEYIFKFAVKIIGACISEIGRSCVVSLIVRFPPIQFCHGAIFFKLGSEGFKGPFRL
ncbi:hypothetical protein KEH51_16495 [[Brevibacterium] frigoritolerans]|uniref:Uncharacterized protein n=1 Tax=Peribacillus frigoritolerans TaxID=450367 RepID=A0A941FLZ2_9BACI|nr:hypothetical protein [Peribacillus frigoritolerans]